MQQEQPVPVDYVRPCDSSEQTSFGINRFGVLLVEDRELGLSGSSGTERESGSVRDGVVVWRGLGQRRLGEEFGDSSLGRPLASA